VSHTRERVREDADINMQSVRMGKSIAFIGLVAACLLLCSARSFQPAPKLYRRNRRMCRRGGAGQFRFIRLDGGQIESWKAERTWWGNKFSAEDKDVLSHIYDRDFERIARLAQAGGV